METVQEIARGIVAREGGFVNDPDDPGGATKHGVTIGTMKRLGIDLDGDGDVDIDDVKLITVDKAVEIYLKHYFYGPKIDQLPEALQASVFDMYVNAGSNAVKILQRLLNRMGAALSDDGVIGPMTLGAVARADELRGPPIALVESYGMARREYYYRLADARPASRKYVRRRDGGKGGWIIRAEEFIHPLLHLTDAQHRARVAAWG